MSYWNEPLPPFLLDEPPNFLFDEPPKRRGSPWLAWMVIIAVLASLAWAQAHPAPRRRGIGQRVLGTVSLTSALNEWQARLIVGRAQLFQTQRQQLLQEAAALDRGTLSQRLRNVALGGELHANAKAPLIERGSRQSNLWGGNLYPKRPRSQQIEWTSLINIRPTAGNPSMEIQDKKLKARMKAVLDQLLP